MCVKLDLPWAVDDDVVVVVLAQLVVQPVEIVEEVFETVDQATVGAEVHLFHYILQRNKLFDVDARLVFESFRGRIQVEEVHIPTQGLGVRNQGRAERRLAGTRRP